MSLFWLDSAERQPLRSSAFMTLSCRQLDLIWSASSPATRSDGAVSRQRGGMWPLSNLLIKALIRSNPWLPNELLSEARCAEPQWRMEFRYSCTGSVCYSVFHDTFDIMSHGWNLITDEEMCSLPLRLRTTSTNQRVGQKKSRQQF